MTRRTPPRLLAVDRSLQQPIYEQIVRQIRRAIAEGALLPGEKLPSVRRIAVDLGINFNTVARAYSILEREGFVRVFGRSRVEVAPPVRKPESAAHDELSQELRMLIARLRQAGVSGKRLLKLVEAENKRLEAARDSG